MNKPDIINVVSDRIDLHRAGHEYRGLCPFHDDHNPSFYVNQEKQVFYCHGCQAGGDVIDFVMLIDGMTFGEACRALGIHSRRTPRQKLTPKRKRAAEVAAGWVQEQRAKLNLLIIELMEEHDLADEIGDSELVEIMERELVMLRGFHVALRRPRGAAELLAVRESIEPITIDVIVACEPVRPLPLLTADYIARLKKTPLDFEGCFR
jgi:uncharacterized membrane protein